MIRVACFVFVVSAIGACKSDAGHSAEPAPEPKAPAPSAASQPSSPTKPAAAPSERVDDPSFELVAIASGPYAVGQLGSFAVSLKPRGEYHINQDYPISITVKPASGLRLPKAEFKKPDAAVFGEKLARFDVPLTPEQAGSQAVEANIRFAVCTPDNCVPDERTLALVLAVK